MSARLRGLSSVALAILLASCSIGRQDGSQQPASRPAAVSTSAPNARPTATPPGDMDESELPMDDEPVDLPEDSPNDDSGRRLGGTVPILNYSPTMVTGKPCPRVKQWKVVTIDAPGIGTLTYPDDPCVAQNAIDDYVQFAWAEQQFNNATQYAEIVRTFRTDHVLIAGFSDQYYADYVASGVWQNFIYLDCDRPTYRLIVPEEKPWIEPTSGAFIEIKVVQVPAKLGDWNCTSRSLKDGSARQTFNVLAERRRAIGFGGLKRLLAYDEKTGRWQLYSYPGVINVPYDKVKALYDAAPVCG